MTRPTWIDALILVALVTLVFGAGWAVNGWRMGAKIAALEQSYFEAQAQAAQDNARTLATAHQRGDALALRLAARENALTTLAQEKHREIARLTTGRPCLDSAAVRLLNEPAGIKLPRPTPETPREPVRADAAFATDTDVGQFIAVAQRSYDTCRGRLDAIADFYQENHE
jgi:hypothetical protein